MADIIQLRRDTAANWTSENPTLANGEVGYETDTGKFKFGDGSTAWTSLGYYTPDDVPAHDHDDLYYTEGEVDGLLHAESHDIASHSDTTATGAELNALTDGSETALHIHDGRYYTESELDTELAKYLKKDGSVALTANWDAGPYEIRAKTFESDQTTGTPPFTVASTSVVPNLNADLFDGVQLNTILVVAGSNPCTGPFPLGEQPIIITVSNDSGSGMSKGDLCYISGDSSGVPQVTLADADAEASASGGLVIIHETIANSADGDAVLFGVVTGFSSLTPGAIQYVSATAGDFTETAPSGSSDIVRVAGYAISTTEIFFNPGKSWVEVA